MIVWFASMVTFSAILILLGGGLAFIRQPIGALYLVLWGSYNSLRHWSIPRGAVSIYDKSQRVFWSLGGPIMYAIVVVAPWEYANFTGPIPRNGLLAWLGLALFAAGIVLQAAAIWSLGGLYTSRLGMQPGHRVVTKGPYRAIRHPGYFGAILCYSGMALALTSIIAIVLSVLFVPILVWRIGCEEEMLLREFGEDYRDYVQKTKRLIPLVY